ncbi:MAG: hypothetical protein Q9227_005479 [Pyrenula ochraceoflavens]
MASSRDFHTHRRSQILESIHLQSQNPRSSDSDDDTSSDLDPESDKAYLRRNRRRSNEDPEDHKLPVALLTFWGRIKDIVMSQDPLLKRSSPAGGSDSYGSVPSTYISRSSPLSSDDENLDVRRKDGEENNSIAELEDSRTHLNGRPFRQNKARRRRRRSSSNTFDFGLGPESRASYANGTIGPGKPGLSNDSSHSSLSPSEGGLNNDSNDRDEDPPDNSPYPEVRASVPATDDTSLSINTPRMWTLSLLFTLFGSAANMFFSLRYPSVTIAPIVALILVHPFGRLWDMTFKRDDDPDDTFEFGVRTSTHDSTTKNRFRLWLAQGKWNEKEHTCIYVSSNVAFGFAFATDVIVEQHKFYKQKVPILYQILLTLSTQILGYAFAGATRRFLVRPSAMIWPSTLAATSTVFTMHTQKNEVANGWRISRYKFFVVVWATGFLWYFFPGLLMPALSYFNVLTWFAPKNVVVANLFGVRSGLGLFPLTFDWAQIAYTGSPLVTPWWAAANVVGGLAIVMWIVAPVLYYRNVLYSAFLPILSSAVFDNEGKPYDVSRILTSDFLFDKTAYQAYSRVYLPITYVLSYAVQFASLSALVTHTAFWHGRDIVRQTKKAIHERSEKQNGVAYKSLPTPPDETSYQANGETGDTGLENLMSGEDVHCRLMKNYEDVPLSWYLLTFAIMLATGIFVVEYYPVHLPWYGLLLALGITTVLFIPVGIVMAIANVHSSLYLICQLICGVVFPGRPVANMVFTTYCYITSAQGIKFSSDMKLGHYMKIPPRLLFNIQMVATIVGSLTQIAVLNWMFVNIEGICTPEAINGFTCPLARVHFNGSILWGVVGPQRFFGPTALYRHLSWAFLVGVIGPVFVFFMGKRKPKSLWRKVNLPVMFGSLSWIPPATGLNFSVWAVVCFTFNSVIKKRAIGWYSKYNMTLSAALDSGMAFSLVVIFFGFVYSGLTKGFTWWGTEVYKQVSLKNESCTDR